MNRRNKGREEHTDLVGGRLLARNTSLNIVGQVVPLIAAVVAIPHLVDGMGTARFGVLTLAWVVVGYFGIFDLGIGRAITQMVAERLGNGQHDEVPGVFWSGLVLIAGFGVFGAIVLAAISPWLVFSTLKIPINLQHETLTSFYVLAATVPFVVTTAGFRGILSAYQRFDLLNFVSVPLSLLSYLGPLLVLTFSNSLVWVVTALAAGRALGWVAHLALSLHVVPALRRIHRPSRELLPSILSVGGWMAISNVIAPVIVYMDRFLIGTVVSISAVAYYATPFEVASKLTLFPGAVMGVLFPAFATSFSSNSVRTTELYRRTVGYVFLLVFPLAFIAVTFAHEGLDIWLGSEFAQAGGAVLQLLVVGFLINSLAHVPFGLLQGIGRPDLTAKLHMIDLLLYVPLLWVLLNAYGIVGAALAWTIRVSLETVALFIMADRKLPSNAPSVAKMAILFCGAIAALALGASASDIGHKVVIVALVAISFSGATWRWVLGSSERSFLLRRLGLGAPDSA